MLAIPSKSWKYPLREEAKGGGGGEEGRGKGGRGELWLTYGALPRCQVPAESFT